MNTCCRLNWLRINVKVGSLIIKVMELFMTENKSLVYAAVLAAALLSPTAVLAQVYKCVDASGKITFSDQGCATDHSVSAVDIGHVNTQDSSQYQQRIFDERLERLQPKKQVRVTVVGDDRSDQQKRMQSKLCKEALTPYKGAHGLTAAQRSMAASCAGLSTSRQSIDHAAPPPPVPESAPAPSHITNCDTAGCWDNTGQRYNHGAGPTHFRQDGKVCQYIAGQMQCN